jgi:ATP-dependent RNA helicase RhlE
LVATDIAARGIDVSEISHVINFDMPDTADAYTHRIGRTGRMARTGTALTLVSQSDLPMLRSIEKQLGYPIERRKVDGYEYELVASARSVVATRSNTGRSYTSHRPRVAFNSSPRRWR